MDYEWLILADFATVVEGKLYLQGGGWSTLTVNSEFPASRAIGIAASIDVPWGETNTQGNFEIEVQNDDGATLAKFGGGFIVGRPPTHPPGQAQRAQVAQTLSLRFENPGTYAIIGLLEGEVRKRTQFNVVEGPMLAMKRQVSDSPQ